MCRTSSLESGWLVQSSREKCERAKERAVDDLTNFMTYSPHIAAYVREISLVVKDNDSWVARNPKFEWIIDHKGVAECGKCTNTLVFFFRPTWYPLPPPTCLKQYSRGHAKPAYLVSQFSGLRQWSSNGPECI